ncbi:Acyl-CoA N-acyltransferase [Cordyceps fumosorosea ARSEF 2679]|uniref:Acyl-CoA N-acyltransferase n=1 Tax=Cordyceps fumosorosea (strain ARSEF 2679) TaxID=1081104 RepID=A0A162JT60_CORFA|nr:Acyl-CoA N-acyltransferase [Cordyceps fumosorosea ARSEF 2679]OAA48798.1 Acyl-CoA N-acyltransferase [Cordyceps fumosorosea ARSEF 2679]
MEQPVGELVSTKRAQLPTGVDLCGRYTGLRRLDPSHAPSLYKHLGGEDNFWRWTYMMTSGFPTAESCAQSIAAWSAQQDPFFYAVYSGPLSDPASEPVGMMSLMAAVPDHRRVEIGSVILGGALVKSRQATEAFYLFLRHAVEDMGCQRVEWKANRLNAPSLAAASRLGFTFEGIFRKHMIVKGRRRDTAWFSITDDEWPAIEAGFEAWLDEGNFDENGKQKKTLQQCREANA